DLHERSAQEEIVTPQACNHVLDRQLELIDGKGAGVADADERAAGADEIFEALQIVSGQLICILLANRRTAATSSTASGWLSGDRDAGIIRDDQRVDRV